MSMFDLQSYALDWDACDVSPVFMVYVLVSAALEYTLPRGRCRARLLTGLHLDYESED